MIALISEEFRDIERKFIGKQHGKGKILESFIETIPKRIYICTCGMPKGSHTGIPKHSSARERIICSKFVLHHIELRHYRRRERYHPMVTEVDKLW